MKRFISIILISILFFTSIGLTTYSVATPDENLTYELDTDEKITEFNSSEEKIFCDATLEDDFEDDSVIVVFKNTKSKKLENHTRKSFSDISAKSVTDLTSRTKGKIEKQRLNKAQSKRINELNATATTDEMQVDENKFHQIIKIDLGVKSKENVLACVKKLEARDDVLMACPNYYFKPTGEVNPNDTCFPATYKYGGQWGSRLIDLPKAWYIIENSSVSTVKVGVLDSGIESTHPDLKNRYNSSLSKDFTGGNSPGTDSYGHGTQVAGIIGAQANNGVGVAGVCWNVSLVSLKVVKRNDDGDYKANLGLVANAIDYSNQKNIPILNFSSCGENEHKEDLEIIWQNYSGLFVCSTTNDGIDVTDTEFAHQEYNAANTIVVAATDKDDDLLVFYDKYGNKKGSSYSKTKVHLAAPGYDIWTTSIGNDYVCTYGTSMATPYVTGVAALLKSKYSAMKAETIKYYIEKNVDKKTTLTDKVASGGRLNAYKALNNVKTYTVEYRANGGTGSMSGTTVIYKNKTALRSNSFTRTNYVFKGWNSYRESDGKCYYIKGTDKDWFYQGQQDPGYTKYLYPNKATVSATTSVNGDTIVMTAQWAPKYKVVFNGNDEGEGTMRDMDVVFGDPYNLNKNTFYRSNCTMTHWYAKKGNLMYYTGATGAGWYAHGSQPNGYTRKEFSDEMYIGASSLTDISGGNTITMNAYWEPNYDLLGDFNMDGSINVKDVTAIQENLSQTGILTAYEIMIGDVNFSGSLTVKDATMIQKYVAKQISEFGE